MHKVTMMMLGLVATSSANAMVANVSNVTMMQDSSTRKVVVSYEIDAPSVVTVDVQTNCGNGVFASIGGRNIQAVVGDINCKVAAGPHTFTWSPDVSWPNHKIAAGDIKAVVQAWAMDATPDIMVVSLANVATPRVRYFADMSFLPGGILENGAYRTTELVMRKIPAKGVTFTMGSVEEDQRNPDREATHNVTLAYDYYMGVFPVTQTQWASVMGTDRAPKFSIEGSMRPMESVSYRDIRESTDNSANKSAQYPNDPAENTFLWKLRQLTSGQIDDWDLPSEAQWEYACRSTHGEKTWNNGKPYVKPYNDPNLPGRFTYNQATMQNQEDLVAQGPSNCTAVVGSYLPNDWGLYDCHGNVWEVCLDWKADDITGLGGAVNTTDSGTRVKRGGSWKGNAFNCRSAYRSVAGPGDRASDQGFRLWCRAGLN